MLGTLYKLLHLILLRSYELGLMTNLYKRKERFDGHAFIGKRYRI